MKKGGCQRAVPFPVVKKFVQPRALCYNVNGESPNAPEGQ